MDLIDRYLVAVRRQLPRDLQDDIVQELGDSLRSEAEDHEQRTGHPLTAEEQSALLKKRGHPWLMASRYLPQQQLIGPALFPYYRQALKLVVFWVVLPIVLFGGAIHAIYSGRSDRACGARARLGVERRHLCRRHRHRSSSRSSITRSCASPRSTTGIREPAGAATGPAHPALGDGHGPGVHADAS